MDGGEAAYSGPRFYASFGGPIDMTAWLVERLVAAPNRTLDLLPGGQARAEKLTTLEVGEGATRQDDHRVGGERPEQRADAGMDRRQRRVLRLLRRHCVASGGI